MVNKSKKIKLTEDKLSKMSLPIKPEKIDLYGKYIKFSL